MQKSNEQIQLIRPALYRQQLITTEDLATFKQELFTEMRSLLLDRAPQPEKKWLRSADVRKLLNISSGTLQNLRINGTLSFTKIGGIVFYQYEDVENMLRRAADNRDGNV